MKRSICNRILASILLGAVLAQPVALGAPKKAEAISFQSAQQGIISAGVGCASSYLLQRRLSSTLSSEITSAADITGAVAVGDEEQRRNTEALTLKETCLKKIARAASQVVLKELTRQTVAWINTGFNGQPLFVRNPSSFFKSIADREVSSLARTFSDKNKYPFGQAFIRGYIRTAQNTLERNAEYNLDRSLGGYTSQQFSQNFNYGGWSAWQASALPQNNPIGFSLLASAELDRRLAGTEQSPAQDIRDELQQGLGFLSPKICVDPMGYRPPSNPFSTIAELEQSGTTLAELEGTGAEIDMCRRYETSTPGGVVGTQLTKALGVTQDNLLLAPEDLDASLQTVFDALLSQLFNKGLASLTDTNSGGSSGNVGVTSSGGYGNNATVVNNNTNTNTNTQWFDQNPAFDISDQADITAVINTQNAYIRAVIDDPAVAAPVLDPLGFYPPASSLYANQTTLVRTEIKGQNYWLQKIIPEIFQLDYCIPGPHPGWENEAQQKLLQFEGKIRDVNSISDDSTLAQIYDTVTLGIVHALANFVSQIFTGETADEGYRKAIYAAYITEFTGIVPEQDENIATRERVTEIFDTLFERFVAAVNFIFSPVNLPSVAAESRAFFAKIGGYQSILAQNNEDVATLQAAVRRLEELRTQVISLNASLAAGSISRAEYDNSIGFVSRSFGSLSASFVTQAEVDTIEDQTREIIQDIVYIHNTLIKGPNGCEAQMPLVPAKSRYRAWPYQQPHLYDYPQEGRSFDLASLSIDPVYNNLVTGIVRPYSSYYPFMQEAAFGSSNWQGYHPEWTEIHITDLLNFDTGEEGDTVWWFEAKLGPLW